MTTGFLHGVNVVEIDAGPRPIRIVRSAVIGLIGTAPDADAQAFPVNQPRLIAGSRRAAAKLDTTGARKGTLPSAIDGIFDQAGAMVVVVRVEEGADEDAGRANVIGGVDAVTGQYTGVQAFLAAKGETAVTPRILIAPGFTGRRTDDGILSAVVDAGGTGYSPDVSVTIDDPSGSGATADATVEDGAVTGITVLTQGSGYTSPTVTITDNGGSGTGATATAHVGQVGNAVVAEMLGIAERLRAVIVPDGPNTTDQDAIAYRGDWGSGRVYPVDPHTLVSRDGVITPEPTSPRAAGKIAWSDEHRGFWWSPSNLVLNGVVGTARPIDFALGDKNARANLLNENEVTTVIREDGFRLWGNRTCASDPKWAFLSVRRTADMIHESLLQAHLWAVDRNITKTYLEDVTEGVNAFLRDLTARGAILGGRCWADEELNSPANIQKGQVYFNFDFTPPYPAEDITFRSHLVNDYLEELV